MAEFPPPPPALTLAGVGPSIQGGFPIARLVWRIYFRGGAHPTTWSAFRSFGPTDARFDHHRLDAHGKPWAQGRAILYAALDIATCVAEVFQSKRVIDRSAAQPWLVGFRLSSRPVLLDLSGTWPTRAGASMAINTGARARARAWSQAIYDAYPIVEGLYYPSSMHANQPSLALYERAVSCIPTSPEFNRPLADPSLLMPLKHIAKQIGYGLI